VENQNNQQTPVQSVPVAAPAPMQPWPEQTPTAAKIQYVVAQKSLNGIGGLLIFWLIVFSLTGLTYVTTFFSLLTSGLGTATEITSVIFTPFIAASAIASVVLIALRKKLGKLASIITVGIVTLYSIINSIVIASTNELGTNAGVVIGGAISSLIFGGLIVLYFVSSKRIKQTLVN